MTLCESRQVAQGVRSNVRTVSVETDYSWTDKAPWHEAQSVVTQRRGTVIRRMTVSMREPWSQRGPL